MIIAPPGFSVKLATKLVAPGRGGVPLAGFTVASNVFNSTAVMSRTRSFAVVAPPRLVPAIVMFSSIS